MKKPFEITLTSPDGEHTWGYLVDLDSREQRWIDRILGHFDLPLPEFIRRFCRHDLPAPAGYYNRTQDMAGPTLEELRSVEVKCSDPKVWQQLTVLAKNDQHPGGAAEAAAYAILAALACANETYLFSPKTGELLCDQDEIRALVFRNRIRAGRNELVTN